MYDTLPEGNIRINVPGIMLVSKVLEWNKASSRTGDPNPNPSVGPTAAFYTYYINDTG